MAENTEEKTTETEEQQEEQKASEEQKEKEESTETENLFHKLYLFGLGLQKDIEESVSNLIEKGEEMAGEKEKVVDDFLKKVKARGDTFENKLEEMVNKTLENMNLVTKSKYEELEKRVQELEDKIKETED